jgi:hypothetical protein
VFVQPFPATGAISLVTTGLHPIWSPNGKELFFNTRGQFWVVAIVTHPSVIVGNATQLWGSALARERGPGFPRDADILKDGNVVGIVTPDFAQSTTNATINVVLNWFEELKQRVPTR